jgi:anti-sigma regulatory factor (Ser/Thr protein kinase)
MSEVSPATGSQAVPDGAVTLIEADFDAATLAELRGALTACGAEHGLVDLGLSNFVLAVNEITTNAVRHGGGAGRLQVWRADDDLWCEVSDAGRGIPAGRLDGHHRPQPGHIGGWGLWLARHICRSVDIDTGRSGTRVLVRYPLAS